jgi:hypothetical protein
MSTCEAALLGSRVNFVNGSWSANAEILYDHCDGERTHRVASGCVHEHVLDWKVCCRCAEQARTQISDEMIPPRCPKCWQIDRHACPVLVVIEPLADCAVAP